MSYNELSDEITIDKARVFKLEMRSMLKPFLILRGVLLPLILVLWTGLCSIVAISLHVLFHKRVTNDFMIRMWSKMILKFVGVRVSVTGLQNLPGQGVLFLFNHQSLLDIPVIHASIPGSFRFGAKIELFKIPLFSAAMKVVGNLPIARGERDEAIKVLEQAKVRIQNGESFVLAPEGTRQREPQIGEFKSGPFILAIRAQAPIVPVVIRGIHRVLAKKAYLMNKERWITEVELKILPVVNVKEYSFEQRHILKQLVRSQMIEAYGATE